MPTNAGEESIQNLDKLRHANGKLPTANVRLAMQKVMQSDAAVFRVQQSLDEGIIFLLILGCKKITEVADSFDEVAVKDKSLIW